MTSILETLVNIAYQNNIDPQEYISYLLDYIEELKGEKLLPLNIKK